MGVGVRVEARPFMKDLTGREADECCGRGIICGATTFGHFFLPPLQPTMCTEKISVRKTPKPL